LSNRYFFHLVGESFSDRDEIGKRFSTSDRAKAYAACIAEELSEDTEWKCACVVVIDERKIEIAKVAVGSGMSTA
jgi:hypothetical protein